jgi:hypothetical protein
MRFRKLRIAWSAVFGIACVLLIVLWVRSYRPNSGIIGDSWRSHDLPKGNDPDGPRVFTMRSSKGWVEFSTASYNIGWTVELVDRRKTAWGLGVCIGPTSISALVPDFYMMPLTAALATTPSIRWSLRFSLRTLLVAMTLAAIVTAFGVDVHRHGIEIKEPVSPSSRSNYR